MRYCFNIQICFLTVKKIDNYLDQKITEPCSAPVPVPVPEAPLFSVLVSACSSALSLRYALDSGEGISQRPPAPLERFADPVTKSFPRATARWVDGVSGWSRFLGFRARSIFISRSGLLTEASGGVLLLCLYRGLCVLKSLRGNLGRWMVTFFVKECTRGLSTRWRVKDWVLLCGGAWSLVTACDESSSFVLPCHLRLGVLSSIDCPLFLQALLVFWYPYCPLGSFTSSGRLTLGLIFFPLRWHRRGFSRSLFLICASVLEDRLMAWSWRSRVFLRLHGFSVAPFVRIIASLYRHWSCSCVGSGFLFSLCRF
ncbi:hypothetical protein HID58_014237 [Brassica napus]|uniref:Uncharacterized protein n=1 Tax=Brassica napus TaxID=3708 RepID=A0ABQ8DJ71_BRANA|nr:hypothetical protein HID58_014237 [Brassica napus]